MEQYTDNKSLCSKICGQDCPQRHNLQMQKFSNLMEKPTFPIDIYGRPSLPITGLPYAVDNTAFYTNMYLKEFAQRSSLHLPHLVEKAFHSNLYSKELAQRHSYLSQRMSSGLEKTVQNNDLYSKDLSLRYSKSQHHKSRSTTSSKMPQSDAYPKDYSQRLPTSRSQDSTNKIYQNSSYKEDLSNNLEQHSSISPEITKDSSQSNYSKETIQRYTYPILKQISYKSSHRRQNREYSQSMKTAKFYSNTESTIDNKHYNKDLLHNIGKDGISSNRYDGKDFSTSNHLYTSKSQISQAHQANDKNIYPKDYSNPPISVHSSFVRDKNLPSWYHFMPNKHTQTFQSSIYNKQMADSSDYQNAPLDVSKKSMLNNVGSNDLSSETVYHSTPVVSSISNAVVKDKELDLVCNKKEDYPVDYHQEPVGPVLIDLDKKSIDLLKTSTEGEEFLQESLNPPMQLSLENNPNHDEKPSLSTMNSYNDCSLANSSFLETSDLQDDFKKDKPFQLSLNDNYSPHLSNSHDSNFDSKCNGSAAKSFQCKICLKQFAQRYYLQIHHRIHTGEKPFHCDLCPKQFVRKDSLQIHRRSHTGERPFQCDICLKHFAQKHYLLIHEKTHSNEKPFKCDICFKHFAQRHYLQVHQKTHTGQKHYECDICKEQFTHKDYLQIHRRSHTGEKPFQCDMCIQKFSRKDTLVIHRRIHTGEKPFECNFCHKMFAQRSKLHIHKRTHIRKKSHQCNVCQKQFAQRYYLHIHMQSHSDEKPFKCNYCQKPFAQKYYLHIHQRVHTGEKPFSCEVCLKRFARRDTLQVHKRTHTGEKPFQCEICNQLFAQKDKLQIHKRTHSGEKPFCCDYCSRQFSQRNTLQLHLRIHTGEKPFKCEICHKNFAQRNYLVIHRRTHTGEKPFHCEKCGQKFARQDTLQIHLRTHMGIHPVPCEICGRKFINMEKLQIHKDSVHDNGGSDNGNANENNTEAREKELTMLCDVSPKTEEYVLQEGGDIVSAETAGTEEDAEEGDKAEKPIHEFPSVTNYLWHTI
ncbi:zinc finger protein 45-like [Octopus vulgaris]|uniref:Zinc finger protein 45-like n=1 Tax=Octopus vulgaris TaxID=6645 RepID=A0AA36BG39_OCTVU|nr:zinc finger protein 45-like [Octopus vulgaris]